HPPATHAISPLSLHDALPIYQKAAAHRRLLIDLIRQRGEPLAGDLNQIVADVDSGHVVPDAREIFADPSRSATDIENLRIGAQRSEEHTSELQSPCNLVCRLL